MHKLVAVRRARTTMDQLTKRTVEAVELTAVVEEKRLQRVALLDLHQMVLLQVEVALRGSAHGPTSKNLTHGSRCDTHLKNA